MSRPKVSDEIRCIMQHFRGDINTVGGIFQHGKAYSHAKKIQVAAAYRVASNAVGGGGVQILVSCKEIAKWVIPVPQLSKSTGYNRSYAGSKTPETDQHRGGIVTARRHIDSTTL